MKKVKFLALLACLVFALSLFTVACMNDTPSSEESEVTSEQVSEPTSDPASDPESVIESDPESEPESEVESEPESTEPELLSVTFMVDGTVFDTCYFTAELPEILEPTVPEKTGYIASWEEYTLGSESITVNAVYEAIEYTITFVGYEAEPIVFTVETMASVVFPTLPTEDGYDIYWDKTEADIVLENMTVNYVREIAKYTVTFVGVDGIDPIEYTADEMASVVFPKAPALEGYEVSWDKTEADLTLDDLTVNYVKVAIEYTITFVGIDGFDPIVFTVETLANVVIPEAPAVDGYLTGWDKSIDDVTLADIEFTYYKMTEEEFYLRDVEGASMVHLFTPFDAENNYVEWDETENAYHYVNTLGNTDQNDRAVLFNREYVIKWAELGVEAITFEIKLDAVVANETLYRGFEPDWYTNNFGFDVWQLTASDWRQIVVNVEDIPMDREGVLKTIFLLGDKGSGLWIKNVKLYNPDFANFTDRDLVGAFSTNPLAPDNRVDYDEQEGAVLFTNTVTDQDDKRGFWMSKAVTDVLTANAEAITFQVKTTENASVYAIATTQNPESGWFSWGDHTFVSCTAGEWVTIRFTVNADIERIALLVTNGSFYLKNVTLIFPEVIPEISELTNESLAKMFVPTAGGSSVAWDETEGAFRFVVDDASARLGDNTRSFTLNHEFMAKLRAVTNSLSFKVKFLNDTNPVNDDRSLYVSYATNGMEDTWYGRHQGVGWQADTWVEVTTVFNPDTSLTLFLLNSTDDFLVKDFAIPQADTITAVHEYEVAPTTAVVTGLGLNTPEMITTIDNAPEGVNGTALSLQYTNIYAGFALSFPEYTGEVLEGYSLSFRIYVASSNPTCELWFYNIEYADHGGNHSDYKATNLVTNAWIDVTIGFENLSNFLNSEGKFVGFQVGLFADKVSNFYIDSLSIVTVTATPDIPLVG